MLPIDEIFKRGLELKEIERKIQNQQNDLYQTKVC